MTSQMAIFRGFFFASDPKSEKNPCKSTNKFWPKNTRITVLKLRILSLYYHFSVAKTNYFVSNDTFILCVHNMGL